MRMEAFHWELTVLKKQLVFVKKTGMEYFGPNGLVAQIEARLQAGIDFLCPPSMRRGCSIRLLITLESFVTFRLNLNLK